MLIGRNNTNEMKNNKRPAGKRGCGGTPYESKSPSSRSENAPSLAPEREEAVFDAALDIFGRDGYRHAHTEEIARRAGISKGLLFYYFSSKNQLYLKTAAWLTKQVERIVLDDGYWQIEDFFDLIIYTAHKSRDVLARFPRFTAFSIDLYCQDRLDKHESVNAWLYDQAHEAMARYFKNVQLERFRTPSDARRAIDLLTWMTDGRLRQQRMMKKPLSLTALCDEIEEWCAMLRAWYYREEYL